MIVDTHAHIYSADEAAYPPIEQPYRPPDGTGTPERLRDVSRAAGVDRVMMVQTTTFYGWDNRFVRDTAARSRDWAAGVCTLNPDDPHSPDVLFALVTRANVRALRTYASGADGRYDHPGNRRLFDAARELGIVVNALLIAGAATIPTCRSSSTTASPCAPARPTRAPWPRCSTWRSSPTCAPSSPFYP